MEHFFSETLLKDRVVLITGAGQGIGKGLVRQFLNVGASVILCGRHLKKLLETEKELRKDLSISAPERTLCIQADVTDKDQIVSMTDQIMNRYKHIDILCNNAGISKEMPLIDMPFEVFDQIMISNMRSAMLVTKTVLPLMIAQEYGRIINIGSGAAIRGLPGSTAYSASKAALVSFTQALGDELRNQMNYRNIRVNAICPGPVDTELFRKSERRQFILDAGGDITTVDEMGYAAVYLASDLSGVMNSQVLILRGFNRW